MLVHHVVFWLKPETSLEDKAIFKSHLDNIKNIESVVLCSVGVPAPMDRPVIDRSYTFSLMTVFNDIAGHDIYQPHEIHQTFLANCKHMWEKVVIYDAIDSK